MDPLKKVIQTDQVPTVPTDQVVTLVLPLTLKQ